jgi:hypothetical protein
LVRTPIKSGSIQWSSAIFCQSNQNLFSYR